ncbi:MAG TPA: ABC transporter permease [Anaerolineales bacterium]|nr:ABC transporter permease [Anaerolineales bacterium]
MTALSIAFKDLQILFKNRSLIVQLFLMPILFTAIMSGALGSLGSDNEKDTRIPLAVVNLDGGEAATQFISGLEAAGGVLVERYNQSEAQSLFDEGKIMRVVTIPADFSANLASNQPTTVQILNHKDAQIQESEAVRLVVEGVAQDMTLESQILFSLQQMGDMNANAPEEYQQAFGSESLQDQARAQFETADSQALVTVAQKIPTQQAEEDRQAEDNPTLEDVAVPGFAVLFVFMTAQTTALSIYNEKKVGSFRRLLAAPISKATLLMGKMLPNVITGILQVVVIFAFGVWGMQALGLKPVSLGNDFFALVLTLLLLVLCSTALGIVIAAIARTEGQIGGLSTLLLWGLGLLGGCLMPLFLLERFLKQLPMVVPHYWAKRALESLLVRGVSLADVGLELAVLSGFIVLFFAFGLWKFDFD